MFFVLMMILWELSTI